MDKIIQSVKGNKKMPKGELVQDPVMAKLIGQELHKDFKMYCNKKSIIKY